VKLSTKLVFVEEITSKSPRSEFPEDRLDELANIILDAGGIINPPILMRTSLESYEVVDGDFEYYAAVKAAEIDPRKGETIGAFIIETQNEAALRKQAGLLRKKDSLSKTDTASDGAGPRLTTVESRLTNMESRFDAKLNDLTEEIQALKADVRPLKEQKTKKVETPLDIFNATTKSNLPFIMKKAGIGGKTFAKFLKNIEAERKKRKFESLIDLKNRVTGLGQINILKIIDAWSRS